MDAWMMACMPRTRVDVQKILYQLLNVSTTKQWPAQFFTWSCALRNQYRSGRRNCISHANQAEYRYKDSRVCCIYLDCWEFELKQSKRGKEKKRVGEKTYMLSGKNGK